METIFCENTKFAKQFMEKSSEYPRLKHVIVFEGDDKDIAELKTFTKFNVFSLKDLEIRGKMNFRKPEKPKSEDLFCICFTSGTTGTPKGVMLTHRNILSCIASLDVVTKDMKPKHKSLMCYLPCAHIYEIINEVFCLFHGGQLGFFSGTTETLVDDIHELKPTILPLVPKLMNRIYEAAQKKIGNNWLKRNLFNVAMKQKEKNLKKGIISRTTMWDKLVFSRLHNHIGSSIQMIFTASAPVSTDVLRFFRCSLGCVVFEVYGLSELGAAAMTLASEHDSGFVGPPLPCNHIKLVSVPEMNYLSERDVGEICVKGLNVFSGYYNNHEATKEALDTHGWYHTGDIGKWLPNGALKVIDRKKHIFKLAQGEYIVPEKVESAYCRSPLVSQMYVDGQSDQDFAVAVIVPDKKAFVSWANERGFAEDFKNLCKNNDVRKAFLKHLVDLGKEQNLNSLQQVGNIFVTDEEFSQDNDLLTPTLKVKRTQARKKFDAAFRDLYKEGNLRKKLMES